MNWLSPPPFRLAGTRSLAREAGGLAVELSSRMLHDVRAEADPARRAWVSELRSGQSVCSRAGRDGLPLTGLERSQDLVDERPQRERRRRADGGDDDAPDAGPGHGNERARTGLGRSALALP